MTSMIRKFTGMIRKITGMNPQMIIFFFKTESDADTITSPFQSEDS